MSGRGHRGMTLIEVLGSLLVLGLGALAVIGLVMYGMVLAGRAQEAATGVETARTILTDKNPIGLRDRSELSGVVSGFLNGYFVRRSEEAAADLAPAGNRLRIITVTAEVFHAGNGALVASLRERQVAVAPP